MPEKIRQEHTFSKMAYYSEVASPLMLDRMQHTLAEQRKPSAPEHQTLHQFELVHEPLRLRI